MNLILEIRKHWNLTNCSNCRCFVCHRRISNHLKATTYTPDYTAYSLPVHWVCSDLVEEIDPHTAWLAGTGRIEKGIGCSCPNCQKERE